MSRDEILSGIYQAAGLPGISLPSKPQRPQLDWSHDPDFPNAVARGARARKTLAPFVPSPLLDMLVLGRIMGTYPDPRHPPEDRPNTLDRGSQRMGLHASGVPDNRPNTAKIQAELERLRKEHPELVAAEADIDRRSAPQGWWDKLWGIGRESGLLAYSNIDDPSKPLIIKPQESVKGEKGYYGVIPSPPSGVYPSIPGYKLQVIEHNHPFPMWSELFGAHGPLPSPFDQDILSKNPTAYGVIRRAGDKINPNIYYGLRTRY